MKKLLLVCSILAFTAVGAYAGEPPRFFKDTYPEHALKSALDALQHVDPALFSERLSELVYLSNVLIAGTMLDGKRFEEVEAARQCLRSQLSTDYKTLLARLRDGTDDDTVWEWTHVVEVAGSGIATRRESWEIVHGLFCDNDGALAEAATTMFHFGEKAVPLAGAAAPALTKDAQSFDGKL